MASSTYQTDRYDIVIAGGSFAALALARGLSQALPGGVRIAIVDRAAAPDHYARDERAFAVWAAAKAALESLGAWPAIAGSALAMASIEISDSALSDGVRPTRLTYDATTPSGVPAAFMVPAAALHGALYSLVADDSQISWFPAAKATGFEADPFGVRLQLADGRAIHAGLCVAADGRGSKLRDAAGIKTLTWAYDQCGIVTTVTFSEPHNAVAIQHFLPGGPFAILPLIGNRACITWSCEKNEAERISALDDEAFLAELDKRIAGRFGTVRLAGSRQTWPLDARLPRDLIAERFVLVGDSAHAVHPIAGQGVNLALRDVAALVEVLADAMRTGFDAGHHPALERYQRWRRFDATMSATAYDCLNRIFSLDNMVVRAGRGAGLGVVDKLPSLKELIIAEAAGLTGDVPKLLRGEAV